MLLFLENVKIWRNDKVNKTLISKLILEIQFSFSGKVEKEISHLYKINFRYKKMAKLYLFV